MSSSTESAPNKKMEDFSSRDLSQRLRRAQEKLISVENDLEQMAKRVGEIVEEINKPTMVSLKILSKKGPAQAVSDVVSDFGYVALTVGWRVSLLGEGL